MKKFLITLSIILSTAFIYAEMGPNAPSEFRIHDLSGGMNTYQSANTIADNQAVLTQNFYTDIQNAVVERNGFSVMDSGIGGGASNVPGLWKFVDSSGNEWIIEFSSRTFYKHTLGGAPTAFGLSASGPATPRAAVNLGRIWFTNGSDSLWWFDGTSTGAVASAPLGKIISAWRTRIVLSNVNASQSTVYFSEDGDGTNWTLGGNPDNPFTIQVGGANDGFPVDCMGNYWDYLVVQRKYDTWIIAGTDQSDVQLQNVSYEAGCIEPGSNREFDGSYMFLSARGIEEMRGSVITRVSDAIRDIVDGIVKNTVNERSITQTTQADFQGGTVTAGNSFYMDLTDIPGVIQTTFPDTFDSYRDGTNGTKAVWKSSTSFQSPPLGSTVSVTPGQLSIAMEGGTLGSAYVQTVSPLSDFQGGTSYYITVDSLPYSGGNVERFFLVFSSNDFQKTSGTPRTNTSNFFFMWSSTSSTTATLQQAQYNGGSLTLISTTVVVPFIFNVWLATTNYSYGVNGIQLTAGTHTWPHNQVYVAFEYEHGGNCARGCAPPSTLLLDDFQISPETFTFTSSIMNPGTAVTAWGNLDVTDGQPITSAITYQFGSTTTASIGAISNWTTVSNHNVPNTATNPYVGVRLAFAMPAIASLPGSVSDFTVNWFEGNAPPMASTVYDGRYWLTYTNQTGSAPQNNKVLIYQRNRTWTLFTMDVSSLAIWRDHLYMGMSDLVGKVDQFDVGNSDDGNITDGLIETKSYDLGQFFREKDFLRTYLSFFSQTSYTGAFVITYTVDHGSGSNTLATIPMNLNNGQSVQKLPFLLDPATGGPNQGREIQFTLTKDDTGDRLKLFDIVTLYHLKEER